MPTSLGARSFENVVLVADVANEVAAPLHERRDLEQSDRATLEALCGAIGSLGIGVVHYQGPDDLARNADRHLGDIVLTIFGGETSRNRMALVPAICESFGLRFIGPDTYGRIIAQDKEVSKRLARDCGVRTPSWLVLRSTLDLPRLSNVAFPCVVKPLLEGSSIGITQDSIVHSPSDAEHVASDLLDRFEQPVLAEQFVAGREVAFVAIERGREIEWAYTEVVIKGDPAFFENRLFDLKEKMERRPGRSVRNIDSDLAPADLQAIRNLLRAYGRFGYCRVDGRMAGGDFHFLEITPDAWIHPLGQFAMGFTEKGWDYDKVIAAVLASAD